MTYTIRHRRTIALVRSLALALGVILALSGCPTRPRTPVSSAEQRVSGRPVLSPHVGRPYDIVPAESLLTIRVYRGGPLAKAGHNHVIASHTLRGTLYVPEEPLRASFELRVPVSELTVDEPELRAREQDAGEFPPEVPESAREGTRRNMLSEALLDGGRYPDILLRAEGLEADPASGANQAGSGTAGRDQSSSIQPGSGNLLAHVQATVHDQLHSFTVPVRYELHSGEVTASGELALKQSDLGLVPFSALLGGLQVQDEMRIRFRLVARR